MKRKARFNPERKRALPANSSRVIHPVLGIRCWLIAGKYYRSRADYNRSLVVKNGVSVDTSIQGA